LWLLKRGDPGWSQTDEQALDQWLAQAPGNRVSLIRLEAIWNDADRLKSIASGLPRGIPARGVIEQSPFFALKQAAPDSDDLFAATGESRRKHSRLAIAVTIFAAIAATFAIRQSGILAGDTYSTTIGGLTSVPMPDGSMVMLNT